MSGLAQLLVPLLARVAERLAEPSTKTGAVGLAINGALATATPDADPVQLVLQVLLALVQLYDIFRRERAAKT